MSRAKLTGKLASKGFDEAEIAQALDQLETAGFLSDRRLAEHWAQLARERQGLGPAQLRQKLLARGFEPDLVDSVLAEVTDQAEAQGRDDRAVALDLARERDGKLSAEPLPTRVRRVAGLLQRKGYDADVVEDVLETLYPDVSR